MTKQYRIAVVNSHPIQYFAPLYAFLNAHGTLNITALYCSDFSLRGAKDPGFGKIVRWDVDLLSGYESVFLGPRAKCRSPRGFWSLVAPELWHEIRTGPYDAVWLHGYNYAAFVLAFAAAKARGLPVFMRSETHLGLKKSGWRRVLRDAVLSIAYKFVDAFMAIGTANRAYYLSLGVPASKIFDVPYTVDNDRFLRSSSISEEERILLRRRLGLPDLAPVILFASKFIKRKHPQDVLRAAAILQKEGFECGVLMVGAGELADELQRLTQELGLRDVNFVGFINQAELPSIYAACDLFVLPSEDEPWGLVVNEVMCAGRPVVVAREAGCAADLVIEGETGAQFAAGSAASLAAALEPLVKDAELRRRLGEGARRVIGNWSYKECFAGLTDAVTRVGRDKNG